MLTRVIFNQKGGVGKSSIAVNLASISASQGYRTLLIDLDPQCNSTQYLLGNKLAQLANSQNNGQVNSQIITPNIETFFAQTLQSSAPATTMLFTFPFSAMLPTGQGDKTGLAECVHATDFDNLAVIPASPVLGEILHQLENKHKIMKLKEGLASLVGEFDRVYIDTPPAFNFFTLSALIAGDRVIVPFDCDIFSKRALQTLVENILETRQDHNPHLTIEGIVVNQYDPRANLPKQVVQTLIDEGYPVFEAKLNPSVMMKESHHANLPLIYLNPKHKLTQQFIALYQELETPSSP